MSAVKKILFVRSIDSISLVNIIQKRAWGNRHIFSNVARPFHMNPTILRGLGQLLALYDLHILPLFSPILHAIVSRFL